jgi:DNA-binding SARP family transcriptional activator
MEYPLADHRIAHWRSARSTDCVAVRNHGRLPDAARPGHPSHCSKELISLRLLGCWSLTVNRAPQQLPDMSRRLVAYLALLGPSGRHAVAGTLWPEMTEERACASLRSALWRLRRAQPALLAACDTELSLSPQVSVDFIRLMCEIRRILAGHLPLAGSAPPSHLTDGDLLPGWYDDWLLLERERLLQLRLHALEKLAAGLAISGRYAAALEAGLAAVRIEPVRESAHRAVIQVHLAEGNLSEALRHYDEYSRLLRAELGLAPSAHMRNMFPPPCRTRLLAARQPDAAPARQAHGATSGPHDRGDAPASYPPARR